MTTAITAISQQFSGWNSIKRFLDSFKIRFQSLIRNERELEEFLDQRFKKGLFSDIFPSF